jgi:hypothetical protein
MISCGQLTVQMLQPLQRSASTTIAPLTFAIFHLNFSGAKLHEKHGFSKRVRMKKSFLRRKDTKSYRILTFFPIKI